MQGELEIINSATPLETRFAHVHPRLYGTSDWIDDRKALSQREPYAAFLKRMCRIADRRVEEPVSVTKGDARGVGCALAHLAMAYRMTGNTAYRETTFHYLDAMCQVEDWTHSLQFGHWAHGMAVAYDWLHDELGNDRRLQVQSTLLDRASAVMQRWHAYVDLYPTGYAWNHSGVVHAGMMAAGCALYGDVKGAAALVQFTLEKLRLMVDALGDDGASAEGLAYGQYHLDFHLKSLIFADQLLGVDFFPHHRFLPHVPRFLLHSLLPRDAWQKDKVFMQFGDTDGPHWYGPDSHLRVIAARYRDGYAQWLADEVAAAGVAGESSCFLNLLYYDETVMPIAPHDLPTTCHLKDKDIVLLRSDWEDGAAVTGIKCGPSCGYHAARHYRNNIGGGHMHPDAGHILLHAGGDWMLTDAGYSWKETTYRNTVLVDGVGQTGEGGTWFEDLEARRGKPEGHIVCVESQDDSVMVITNPAPAYEPAAGLKRYLRHFLYVKPDLWVLVDELQMMNAVHVEQRFHAPVPFEGQGDRWSVRGPHAALHVACCGPSTSSVEACRETVKCKFGKEKDVNSIETLLVRTSTRATSALLVTVLHVAPVAVQQPRFNARLEGNTQSATLDLSWGDRCMHLALAPGQPEPETGIFTITS